MLLEKDGNPADWLGLYNYTTGILLPAENLLDDQGEVQSQLSPRPNTPQTGFGVLLNHTCPRVFGCWEGSGGQSKHTRPASARQDGVSGFWLLPGLPAKQLRERTSRHFRTGVA